MSEKQKIDAYLGSDTYDNWLDLQRRFRREKSRHENTVKKLAGVYDNGISVRVELLERLNFDYERALKMIAQGKKLDKTEVVDVAVLFELAIDTVEAEIDLFEAVTMTGVAAAFIAFPFALFAAKAGFLRQKQEELKKLLEKAKSEVKEAWIQKGLDVALTVITVLAPELGLIEKFAVGAGKLAYDHFLGPKTPDSAKVAKTTFTTYSGSVAKIKGVGNTTGTIVKSSGKAVKYYGVVFDWNEILQGYNNVNAIEKAMKDVEKAYNTLVKVIKDNEAKLVATEHQFKKVEVSLRDSRTEVENLRDLLEEEIKNARYSSPKSWRVIQ